LTPAAKHARVRRHGRQPRERHKIPEHAIEVHQLVRQFKRGPRAVDGIDLHVDEGEIYGCLGPNGAGKSTTVKMLVTLLPPTSGRALVGGHDVSREGDEVRRLIGVALQEAALDPLLTATEHVLLQGGMHGYSSSEAKRRGEVLLERVGLSGAASRRVGTYSGGMRRRLDLALALVHAPRIVFLDEPTTGLDPQSRAALWEEVRRLAKEEGVTVFLTTQYLEEADALADRISIINRGRLVAEGTPTELKAEVGRPTVEVVPELDSDRDRIDQILGRFGERVPGSPNLPHAIAYQLRGHTGSLPQVIGALDTAGIALSHLELHSPSLDDVFLAKTGRLLEGEADTEAPAEPQDAAAPAPEVKPPEDLAGVDLRQAAAGRSKIERLPTSMLKNWMADRALQEAQAQQQRKLSLEFTKGPLAGTALEVTSTAVLGREGDIVIADPEVSRRHAAIRLVDGSLVIDDLQSLNGTWVNDKRIELPTLLAPGDVITLGTSAIEVRAA
jgi:ABC-2 type transport system ATP-binding protein